MKLLSVLIFLGAPALFGMQQVVSSQQQEQLAMTMQKLKEIGLYYEPIPQTDTDSLDETMVMNPFWRRSKALPTRKERKKALQQYYETRQPVCNNSCYCYPWALERYDLAAQIYVNPPQKLGDFDYYYGHATRKSDAALLVLLLNKTEDLNMLQPIQGIIFRRLYKPEMAQLVLARGIPMPPAILHDVMMDHFSSRLIAFYRSHGANPFQLDDDCDEEFKKKLAQETHLPVEHFAPKLPLAELAGHSHGEPKKVLKKFDALIKDLSPVQILQMFNHNAGIKRDVISILQDLAYWSAAEQKNVLPPATEALLNKIQATIDRINGK